MNEKQVKKGDMVTIYGTGKTALLPKGVEYKVHTIHADALIGAGRATKEKPSKAEKA